MALNDDGRHCLLITVVKVLMTKNDSCCIGTYNAYFISHKCSATAKDKYAKNPTNNDFARFIYVKSNPAIHYVNGSIKMKRHLIG